MNTSSLVTGRPGGHVNTIVAERAGVCAGCHQRYDPGTRLAKSRTLGWVHPDCIPRATEFRQVDVFEVYADGSSLGNPGLAGWAWFVSDDLYAAGAKWSGTNQEMEMVAATEAILTLGPEHPGMTVLTDSEYVVNGTTKWSKNWKKNGWRTQEGNPVKNKSLWLPLLKAYDAYTPKMVWIKGHDGTSGNEKADELARQAAQTQTGQSRGVA